MPSVETQLLKELKRPLSDSARSIIQIVRSTARQLYEDECGVMWTMELILCATIMVIGGIVGLATYRDAIVQEFGDMAAAAAELDHSYSYSGHSNTGTIGKVDFDYSVAGSRYQDLANFCEPAVVDPLNAAPMCITIVNDGMEENAAL